MKAATLLLALCVGTSRAFCPSNTPVRKTSLNVASVPPEDLDSWSNKPLNSHEKTTPVADPKFNAFNRMMMKDVVLSPDYSLTWAVALCGPLIMAYHPCTYIHYIPIKSAQQLVSIIFFARILNSSFCFFRSLYGRRESVIDWYLWRWLSHSLCNSFVGTDISRPMRL